MISGCAGGAPTGPPVDTAASDPAPASSTASPAPAAAAPAGSPASGPAQVPVLGATSAGAEGYGTVRPTEINGGGDASGVVEGVRWSSWGGARATGTGTASYAAPDQPLAAGKPAQATLVAFDLGQCAGRTAYRKLVWYFPAHGEKFDPANAQNVCER
jgi:hypothetical protein